MFKRTRKYKKLSYHDKKYPNPYFRKKRKKKKVKIAKLPWRAKLILLEILVVFAALAWFFFFSDFFTLNYININGSEKIPIKSIRDIASQQTKHRRFLFGSQENLILYNANELAEKLNQNYVFEWLTIEKQLPNQLIINFAEKKYAAVWHELEKYYYIDDQGNIIEEINQWEIKLKNYPLIDNQAGGKIQEKKIVDQDNNIQYVIKLFEEFKNSAYDFSIERFILDNEINTVKMALINGPVIYFNTDKKIDEQVVKLTILIKEKLKDGFNSKSYIDLRYGDRIYYR